jgi:NADH dehydrogenase
MILVTGGTGFIGRALVRHLVEAGYPVRTLIRPSPRTPRLPIGVPVDAAVVGLGDTRGLRAALRGVDTVFHLASAERQGARADLLATDIQGTLNLSQAAAESRVRRFFFVSHLGADRASAFPVMKAKGIAEEHIRRSGVPYTILRSSLVFGPEDRFTTGLAWMIRRAPFIMPIPGEGQTRIQPLWVEDLVTSLLYTYETPETANQTYEIGGSEYFPLRQVIETIMQVTRRRRWLIPLGLPTMRALIVYLEQNWKGYPASAFWLDYVSVNRTCDVNSLPRHFGLMPARFAYRLDYLAPRPRPNPLEWARQRASDVAQTLRFRR